MNKFSKYQKIAIIIVLVMLIIITTLILVFIKIRNSKKIEVAEVTPISNEVIEEDEEPIVSEITDANDVIEKEDDTSWDDEDSEDTKVDKTKKENSDANNKATYYIKINYAANCVTVYAKDEVGQYTIPVKSIVCSTGTATPTSGVYKMSSKYRWHQLNGGVYGQYCSRITGHILFHSVPYATDSPDSLKFGAYDKLGTKASAGCIRLTTQDAMWIYNNCASGTYVEFYSSSDPGPLGKPSAQKISSNETCRNWDPTDPTPGNPWHTFVEPTPQVQPIPVQTPEPQPQPVIENPTQQEQTNTNNNSETQQNNDDNNNSNDQNDNNNENKNNSENQNNNTTNPTGQEGTENDNQDDNTSSNNSNNEGEQNNNG